MSFHVMKGDAFLGCRHRLNGAREVVYDEASGKRVILSIREKSVTDKVLEEALIEALASRNILGGVISALALRKIDIDYA